MKTAYLLFGLASACVSGQPAETQFPLCGKDGAPACGNIGQVGRNEKAPAAIAREARGSTHARQIVEPTPISTSAAGATALAVAHAAATAPTATSFVGAMADTSRRMVPVLTRVLVGASSEIQRVSPLHRPLTNHREEVTCGNVMTKGGRSRQCYDGDGRRVNAVMVDDDGNATGEIYTYPR